MGRCRADSLKMDSRHQKEDEKTMREPPCGEPIWVWCGSFRCLAVRNSRGQWRTFIDNKPLEGEVSVIDDQTMWRDTKS